MNAPRTCAIFVAGIALGMSGRSAAIGARVPIGSERVTPLARASLGDLPGHALTAVVVDYAPGGTSVAHHHAGSVFAYVLAGAIRSRNSATGDARTYRTGESFFEPVGSRHTVSANASLAVPARLLAVFVAPAAARLTTPDRRTP